jgi:hypothetical protein
MQTQHTFDTGVICALTEYHRIELIKKIVTAAPQVISLRVGSEMSSSAYGMALCITTFKTCRSQVCSYLSLFLCLCLSLSQSINQPWHVQILSLGMPCALQSACWSNLESHEQHLQRP